MLGAGDTVGVFQLESSGMRDVLRKMHPDRFEDIIAIVALYRPGPMDNIPRFIALQERARNRPTILHPLLEPILKETYGVIVYQEQVMQIAQILAGYSLGEADLLRRAMGKKIKSEMDAQKERFVAGAEAKGVEPAQADDIFELVAKFAGYGFNKSHAAAYAHRRLSDRLSQGQPSGRVPRRLDDARSRQYRQAAGVPARGAAARSRDPRRPRSTARASTSLVRDGDILYSLAALKNVGRAAVEHVETVRRDGPFASLGDFARRVDPRVLTKRALESMAKAGAFDGLHRNRAEVLAGVEAILATASRTSAEIEAGQVDLFWRAADRPRTLPLPQLPSLVADGAAGARIRGGGFLPLGPSARRLYAAARPARGRELCPSSARRPLKGADGGAARRHRHPPPGAPLVSSGNRFAFVGFSDPTGQFEAVCFADTLAACRDLLEPGKALILRVEADVEGEEMKLRLQAVEPLEEISAGLSAGLTIYLTGPTVLELVGGAAHQSRPLAGPSRPAARNGREARIGLGNRFTVTPALKGAIKAIPGVEAVEDL